jgi:uncharacterized protein YaaN involved in tellurite resistance
MDELTKMENEITVEEDLKELSEDEQQKVASIVDEIDVTDTQGVIQYGIAVQKDISSFSDTILNSIKTKDTGHVGESLTDLVINVKDLDVDSLGEKGAFGNLFGGIKRRATKFMSQYEKVSLHIDKIVDELDNSKMALMKDIQLLDTLYDKNLQYLRNLDLYILAGNLKLEELKTKVLPEMKAAAEASNDAIDAQKYKDFMELVNRFEKKLHDLKLSRMISIQTAPQIRLIQNNDQVLVEKIQSSILNTIPLWKNQIIIAITLLRQEKALQLQQEVTDTTNELLMKNSELLKDSTIKVAKESERGIVEIETLKKVNADLITTIEETIQIQQEGKIKRAQAEQDLATMETELKDKLIEVKND